ESVDLNALHEFLDNATGADAHQRATVLWHLADAHFTPFGIEPAEQAAALGVELAATSEDRTLGIALGSTLGRVRLAGLRLDDAVANLTTAANAAWQVDDLWWRANALTRLAMARWVRGELQTANDVAGRSCDLVERHHDWTDYSLA